MWNGNEAQKNLLLRNLTVACSEKFLFIGENLIYNRQGCLLPYVKNEKFDFYLNFIFGFFWIEGFFNLIAFRDCC